MSRPSLRAGPKTASRLLAELEGESHLRARYACELVVLDLSGVEPLAAGA
jgi:hypothetical protein